MVHLKYPLLEIWCLFSNFTMCCLLRMPRFERNYYLVADLLANPPQRWICCSSDMYKKTSLQNIKFQQELLSIK